MASARFGSSTTLARVPASMLRLRSSWMPACAPGRYTVANGTSATPRRWKPQPAIMTASTTKGVRAIFRLHIERGRCFRKIALTPLDHKVDEPAGHDHDLLHVLAGD